MCCETLQSNTACRARMRSGGPTPQVHAELERGVDAVNARQARVAHIRKFSVIQDDFSIDNGCLTPTQKIRRNVVQRQYAAEIEALYREELTT